MKFIRLIRVGIHFYIFGLIILTLGIALTIQSTLGTSPFDALLVGLHRTFGLTIGSWEIIVGGLMILGNALIEQKKPEYYAFLTALVTGTGIDAWLLLLQNWVVPQEWPSQTICLILGIVLTSIGIATYLQSRFAPNPMDRSMLVLSKLMGWSVARSRVWINIILVIIAFLFGGSIGIGTLANALFSGMLIGFFLPYANAIQKRSTLGQIP